MFYPAPGPGETSAARNAWPLYHFSYRQNVLFAELRFNHGGPEFIGYAGTHD